MVHKEGKWWLDIENGRAQGALGDAQGGAVRVKPSPASAHLSLPSSSSLMVTDSPPGQCFSTLIFNAHLTSQGFDGLDLVSSVFRK